MDMAFAVVTTLSHYLYPDGFECIGQSELQGIRGHGCPANDHMNGDRDYSPHMHSKGAGAYAIRHEWI